MNQKRNLINLYLLLSFTFLVLGIKLISPGTLDITGAVIGAERGYNPAMGMIFTAASLFMLALAHYQREQYDKDINSFRRWLEGNKHTKIDYAYAQEKFEEGEQRYHHAVGEGIIKKSYLDKPLKFIEDYLLLEERGRQEKLYSQNKKDSKLEKAVISLARQKLNDRQIPTHGWELAQLAKDMNYYTKRVKEGYGVYRKKEDGTEVRITEIPQHNIIARGTAIKILKDLDRGYRHKARSNQ